MERPLHWEHGDTFFIAFNHLMLILGIETSGRNGSVALWRDGVCLEERSLEQLRRRHAQTVVAAIDGLFKKFQLRPADCQLVAVSLGPGSFTGLRVGIVCAKTFAYATGAQVVGVDTFQCIAENSPPDVAEVSVIEDAQRGDLFVGFYRRTADQSWSREGPIQIVNTEKWGASRKPSDVVTGPALEKIAEKLAGSCRLLDQNLWWPRASVIAELGLRKIEAGQADEAWTLEPFYLRKSAAEEKWDATHQNADQ